MFEEKENFPLSGVLEKYDLQTEKIFKRRRHVFCG